MDLDDRQTIQTPEGLNLDLTLAGLGSRILASLVDAIVLGLVIVGIGLGTNALVELGIDELLLSGLATIVLGVTVLGFFIGFEAFNEGRTPGKRMLGIRVVTVDGDSIGFLAAFLRTLLRLIDFLPAMYVIGSITILITASNQRLGDIAAGTIVIRERIPNVDPAAFDPPDSSLPKWDVTRVSDEDVELIRRFAVRRRSIPTDRADQLAGHIAAKIRPKVTGEHTGETTDIAFLLWVLSQKTR